MPCAARERSLVAPTTFRFLGQAARLEDIGWDGEQQEKLWRYNQHYFDDLNAQGAQERSTWHGGLLAAWVEGNPPATGTGWEPYPTSLRIVNWIKWALAGHVLPAGCVQSLAVQARWLTNRLEIHLLGNHLFANAKALVFAGLFFEGKEAQGWLETGMTILAREVPEQILADGGHFERSTMYHALALEDMLDLCNMIATFGKDQVPVRFHAQVADWRERLPAMVSWLQALCHPDGEISFFNDAAIGIAPHPADIIAYAQRVQPSAVAPMDSAVNWLAQSGYARVATANAVALLDMAPIGPDYLPGHAHADTLSFELSLYGDRVVVNAGTSRYGLGAQRLKERGTRSHSTVTVAGHDSSEVWGGFRVARRARVHGAHVREQADGVVDAGASHDGYARLPGRPVHSRQWQLEEGALLVRDRVDGTEAEAIARFHLHPEIVFERGDSGREGRLHLPNGRSASWRVEQGEVETEPSAWHPGFGVSLESTCLCIRLVDGASLLRIEWPPT